MKKKHVTINHLIFENGFKRYLEIGHGAGHNFRAIRCEHKVGIDPELQMERNEGGPEGSEVTIKVSSDEYFDQLPKKAKFDLIFIDGLHHADQVERDIVNAWNHLKLRGLIILHDVYPHDEAMQEVPRKQETWTGDVWRAFVGFVQTYPEIETRYYEEKYGLGCIVKDRKKVEAGFVENDLTFEEFNGQKDSFYGNLKAEV